MKNIYTLTLSKSLLRYRYIIRIKRILFSLLIHVTIVPDHTSCKIDIWRELYVEMDEIAVRPVPYLDGTGRVRHDTD